MSDTLDFQALFNHSPNPYMVLDRELRYVAANQAYLRVTASRLEALVGRSVFDAFPHDPADPHNVIGGNLQLLQRELAGNERAQRRLETAVSAVEWCMASSNRRAAT
jgi:PAS domain S-box-containing protein